jgi:small nuclear ribonucleoprotein (snRNP)-like protein
MNWLFWRQPYPELRTVIVNLKTGRAFKAVIWRRSGPFMVLKNATMLNDGTSKAVDGEVLIQMADIEFIQVI